MPNYKLLTPGPLTTTDTVKEMMFDHCTWDEDYKRLPRKSAQGCLSWPAFLKIPIPAC